MKTLATFSSCAALSSLVFAQTAIYDAGRAGAPAVPENPTAQGWTEFLGTGQVSAGPFANDSDSGLNAWGIFDGDSGTNGSYRRFLPIPQSFDLSITVKITASDAPYGVSLRVQTGGTLVDDQWRLGMEIVGDDIVVTQRGFMGPTVAYVCPGGASGYHTYRLQAGPNFGPFLARFLYDGNVLGVMEADISDLTAPAHVAFGTDDVALSSLARLKVHRIGLDSMGGSIGAPGPCSPTVPNSTGQIATMDAFGSDLIGGLGFVIRASQMPPNQFGYFLMSFGTGAIPLPASQGTLCLDPTSISRAAGPLGALNTGPLGVYQLALDTLNMPTNPSGPVGPGTVYFQAWFRDANPGPTSNLSDIVAVTLQ